MTEREELAAFCRQMGVAPPQDTLMASRILKRADQLAEERGIERLEAVRQLLQLMLNARGGDGPAQGA